MVFVDHYERSLDSKFRLVLPKKFREDLGPRVYLARSDVPWPCTPRRGTRKPPNG